MSEHIETWGIAHELTAQDSLVLLEHACAKCGVVFKAGDWARTRYGPRGGTNFHDDCTDARAGDEEIVEGVR